MAIPPRFAEAAGRLFAKAALSREEEERHLAKARSSDYWRALLPEMGVNNPIAPAIPFEDDSASDHARARTEIQQQGYFQLDSVYAQSVIGRMRRTVETLLQHGWPPVFSFVYDEFWQITHTPTPRRLLEGVLGSGYRHIPNIWTFYIRPVHGTSGWAPHVDSTTDTAGRLTLWIPLSDATIDNGCIYVVPRDLVPNTPGPSLAQRKRFTRSETFKLLQRSRALPARSGALLGWGFDVLHWGSACLRAGPPRVSMSTEFISADEQPTRGEEPLMDPANGLPSFERRLETIGRALLAYGHFEPLVCSRFKSLAAKLSPRSC